MIKGCPNIHCQNYNQNLVLQRDGRFFRKSDSRWINRFRCPKCGKRFSAATYSPAYRQNKRRINQPLRGLLSSGVSLRRSAKLLNVSRTTIDRKLIYLATQARLSQEELLQNFRQNKIKTVEFDDLITIEHTKMKPLTVSLAVDPKSRIILGAEVGRIPAFGLLAKKSREKYGPRPSEHLKTLERLFYKIAPSIDQKAYFKSDEHKFYPLVLKKFFYEFEHLQVPGGRSCVAGQGELKRKHHDPIFYINHSCAILRANINRLFRKTWCSNKQPERLKDHLDIFIDYYNREILHA